LETSRALRTNSVEPRRRALGALRRAQPAKSAPTPTSKCWPTRSGVRSSTGCWSRMPLDRGFIDKLLDLVLGGARAPPTSLR
jgi:hypothetical protein